MTVNKSQPEPQPRRLLGMIEPTSGIDEMTDEELDDFADSLFDKVRANWEKGK